MNDNVTPFTTIKGGQGAAEQQDIPESTYVVTDIDEQEYVSEGFLVFTSHHIAVMREIAGLGALPVLVLPLHRVKSAELLEDDTDEDAPF